MSKKRAMNMITKLLNTNKDGIMPETYECQNENCDSYSTHLPNRCRKLMGTDTELCSRRNERIPPVTHYYKMVKIRELITNGIANCPAILCGSGNRLDSLTWNWDHVTCERCLKMKDGK